MRTSWLLDVKERRRTGEDELIFKPRGVVETLNIHLPFLAQR